MDILVGYVTLIYDDQMMKLQVTQQENSNKQTYDYEEKICLAMVEEPVGTVEEPVGTYAYHEPEYRSIPSPSLVQDYLFKKVRVQILDRGPYESLLGLVNVID